MNQRLRKTLQPKNAIMVLNEMKTGVQFTFPETQSSMPNSLFLVHAEVKLTIRNLTGNITMFQQSADKTEVLYFIYRSKVKYTSVKEFQNHLLAKMQLKML
jgi:hypothetical protein